MYRKKLIQKIQQLIDKLPISAKRKEAKKDLLELKLSKNDKHFILLQNKYKVMKIKKEVKSERITIRVSSNTKRGIKILSNKKGKTISLYLSDLIEEEIERSNITTL